MKFLLILLTAVFLNTAVYAQQKGTSNHSLIGSLAELESINQKAAQRHAASGKLSSFSVQQWNNYQDSVFEAHAVILKKMFDTYGYPGYDLVGKDGSNNYWRMVQHCDKHPAFQMKVLKSMKK